MRGFSLLTSHCASPSLFFAASFGSGGRIAGVLKLTLVVVGLSYEPLSKMKVSLGFGSVSMIMTLVTAVVGGRFLPLGGQQFLQQLGVWLCPCL